MVNFNYRTTEIHDPFLREIEKELKLWGYEVSVNGRENLNPELSLNRANDPGSREIRFSPDLAVVVRGETIFLDPKAGRTIEKEPYEHYIEMLERDIDIYIVSRRRGDKVFCHLNKLILLPPSHHYWPTVDGWITPRASRNYEEYKRCYPPTGKPYPGSGTPFRGFDKSNMNFWTKMYFAFGTDNGPG